MGTCFKGLVEQICKDNDLSVKSHIVSEKRNTWEHTYDKLKEDGYRLKSRSIKDIQLEKEKEMGA